MTIIDIKNKVIEVLKERVGGGYTHTEKPSDIEDPKAKVLFYYSIANLRETNEGDESIDIDILIHIKSINETPTRSYEIAEQVRDAVKLDRNFKNSFQYISIENIEFLIGTNSNNEFIKILLRIIY